MGTETTTYATIDHTFRLLNYVGIKGECVHSDCENKTYVYTGSGGWMDLANEQDKGPCRMCRHVKNSKLGKVLYGQTSLGN